MGIQLLECGRDQTAVLVLELSGPPPSTGFAVRMVNNNKQQGENEWQVIKDWTPQQAASGASRHYISGSSEELKELADYLAAVCSRLQQLLTGEDPTNTLSGEGADLAPSAAPLFFAAGGGEGDGDGGAAVTSQANPFCLWCVGRF